MNLSEEEARIIFLQRQGLLRVFPGNGKKAALAAVRRLGYVQIDTLSVAARAHHHTLWTRNTTYRENYLSDLLKEKKIFEYWSHAAAFLPMDKYRFSLVRKELYKKGKIHWFREDNPKMKKYVLSRILKEGPLPSRAFEHVKKGPGSWYEWKPAKRALEQLFMEGRLMVAERKGFQKVYDLAERVLPVGTNLEVPGGNEYCRHLIEQSLQANGLISLADVTYLQGHLRSQVRKNLRYLVEEGTLSELTIDGKGDYFGDEKKIHALLKKPADEKQVHILSPFDNSVIQRKRLSAFFGYEYFIECYLPENKRKFGYYCLPVLYGNRFVARFDPKANREEGIFYLKNFHIEKGWKPDDLFLEKFYGKITAFAHFCGCSRVKASDSVTASIRKLF